MKFVPQSVWITLGSPTFTKKIVIDSTTFLVDMARRVMASGNLELAHIIVNKYQFPDFVLGKGPTQSIITRSNGLSLMVVIAMPGLGFPAFRKVSHGLQNFFVLVLMPGQ